MAMRLQMNFSSTVLRYNAEVDMIVPQRGVEMDRDKKLPVLFLLHGAGSGHSEWLRNTRIEELAEKHQIIVVCPDGENSSWSDMYYGANFFGYVTKELYDFAHSVLPASDKREDNFIAGLSMGGHGAMKAALTCPENYYGVASLSGAVHIAQEAASGKFPLPDGGLAIFGPKDQIIGSKNDLFALAEKLKDSDKVPPYFYSACGTEDFTYGGNAQFRDHLKELGFDLTYEEGPGAHTWDFWNEYIAHVLDWIDDLRKEK